jgi:2-dehydro-3-deoxygluconokinase
MQVCDVLITTEEDTEKVFGITGKDYEDVAAQLARRFPLRAVAITLRDNPLVWKNTWTAIAYQGGTVFRTRSYEVEIVDRIGAGDAFSGGLITARLENRGWDEALRLATATSALKHSIPGDFCLVTRAEVDRLLRGASLRVSR